MKIIYRVVTYDRTSERMKGSLIACHDFAARQRSYTLLADAFGLAPPGGDQ